MGTYADIHIEVYSEGAAAPSFNTADIANTGTLSLTDTFSSDARAWKAKACREGAAGPGFSYDGVGWNGKISGLVTYWY